MTPFRPRRSALYLPASNPRALEKARAIAADVVIIDLEDAVAPDAKDAARAAAVAALAAGGYAAREMVLRINAPDSAWFDADIAAAATSGADAILIPKVSDPQTLREVGKRLTDAGAPERTRIWAMIETALALLRLEPITAAARDPATRLAALVVGANDLARETRARIVPGRAPMLPWLAQIVAAARAYDLSALDGVYNDFADLEGCRTEALQGRDLGFEGKTLVHPSQAAPVNAAFAPTAAEVAAARRIIAAFGLPENRGKGAIALDGAMVERLHAAIAERVLALDAAVNPPAN